MLSTGEGPKYHNTYGQFSLCSGSVELLFITAGDCKEEFVACSICANIYFVTGF